MAGKSYRDLEREVWEKGTCAGCGACVAVCPADAIHFPAGTSATHPVTSGYCKEATDSVPCGACYDVCPRVEGAPVPVPLLGECQNIVTAKAGFDVPGKQSGGAVTAILLHALEAGLIDAVVTVAEDRWNHRPASIVITSSEVLVHQAGSRYNWWVPLVASLKEAVVTRKYRRVAVVGVPCVVAALARIRASDNQILRPFRRSIRLVIGLFCTESFDYEQLIGQKLGREHGIAPWQITRIDVKGKLEVSRSGGKPLVLPLAQLAACIRPGCHVCTDFTGTGSDISAGSVGAPDGFTTLLIRTDTGKGFIEGAVQSGRLVLGSDADRTAIERLAAKKKKRQKMPNS
jgi:coenzyme F420 hydrogenase subunit beta